MVHGCFHTIRIFRSSRRTVITFPGLEERITQSSIFFSDPSFFLRMEKCLITEPSSRDPGLCICTALKYLSGIL